MTLLLTNDDAESLLSMPEVIDELEIAYSDLAQNQAINRNRSDTAIPRPEIDASYVFKSMEGGYPRRGVYALRISSDIIQWPGKGEGQQRKEKLPTLPGNRWLGLVLLFGIENGELLAVIPDGIIQRFRVGATNGLGIKMMARQNARRIGLIGAGFQAGTQALAACAVRPIDDICVYSPTPAKREAFAREWSEKLGVPVIPVNSAKEAVTGADIVLCATNSMQPVIQADWLQPGMHLSSLKRFELPVDCLRRADRVTVHTRLWEPDMLMMGDNTLPDDALWAKRKASDGIDWLNQPEIGQLTSGQITGRNNDQEITCFMNNVGLGLQFAATGALILDKARRAGLGKELPLEWFTQTVVS
jgi:ornithine cyclodeaminase/alanine dehydrogenase-like protein (mu-crystallin family)